MLVAPRIALGTLAFSEQCSTYWAIRPLIQNLREIGFEPIKSVLKTKILPIKLFPLFLNNFLEVRGIEPLSHVCKTQILNQLNYTPPFFYIIAIVGLEPTTKPLWAAHSTNWIILPFLGRKGSNLRMLDSKPNALPLGDVPIFLYYTHHRTRTDRERILSPSRIPFRQVSFFEGNGNRTHIKGLTSQRFAN